MSDAVREAVSAATADPAPARPTPAGRPTVLVVDDEDGLRTVLSELLRQDGFTVIEAASGAEALARAGEQPAVIVLDVGLPDLDGFEVCRRLRADPSTAPIPVLQISGMFRDVEDQVRGLETGADAYLTRPVEQAELVTTVRALLRVRRAEAGLRESESRRRAAEALADVGRVLAQSLDPAEVGQRIASTVRALLGAEVSTLYRLVAETGDLVAVASDGDVGPTGGRPVVMPRGSGVSGLAVRQRAPVVTSDWLADPRISVPPEVRARAERAEFRAVLAVPLLIQDRVTGALAVGARAGRAFDATAIRLAQALADQAALALENARLYAETHERLRETQILLAIARVLSLSLPAEEAMRQVSRSVAQAFGADMVGMYVLDGRRQALVPIAGYHVPPELRRQFREAAFPVTTYAGPAEAWETLQPAWTGEAMGDPRWFSGELLAGFPPHSVLFAPTPVHGVPVGGLFLVWWRPGRVPTAAELRLVAGIATQVGLALENAELARRTRQKLGETEALLDIARAISSTLELRDLLRLVTQRTARVVGADRCAINLWRAGHLVPVMGQFADGRTDAALWARFRAARPDGLEGCPGHAEVLRTRQPLVVDDVRHSRGVLSEWVEALGVRAALIVPLIHQDRVIGTLCLDRTDGPHRWEDAEVHLATSVAAQAALAVENAGLYQRAAQRADKQRALATLTALITQAADSAEVVRAVARAASTLLGARLARVWVDDPARRLLRVRGTSWLKGAADGVGTTVSGVGYGEGMAGRVFLAGQPIYVEDLAGDERVADRRLVAEAGLRAYAGLPLVAGDRTLGVLSLLFAERRQFDAEEAELMRLLADHAAIALRNARLYEEVRNTRDFLQSIAENSADAIITTDIHGQITYLSPAGEEMFGFRGAETVGTHVGEYYRGGVDEARDVMRRLRLEGRVTNHETEIRTRAGGWVRVNGSFSLLRDTSGLVIGTLGVTKDVTEQKRAEAAVRAGDARFRALIEHSSDAIALTDARGICLYASPATARILGWGPDALVGRDVADLVHAEDRPGVTGRLAQLLERPGTAVASGEFRVRHRDGSWRWIEGVGSNLLGEPSVRALVFNYRDATERRTLEEHLRHSQKMDAVGRLAGGVAHDFNNLLTVILGRSELILSRLDPAAPSARDIKLVLQTGERAMSLTRQLLAFSRGQVLQPRVIDLDGVVAEMEQMLRRLIGEHLDLVTRPGSGGGRVRVDPGQLEQVLLNLAVNARDAMPHGGRLTIETASVEVADAAPQRPVGIPPGRYLRLAVSDTGVGMDAATQSRLFEPFFTTKELGKGTGLGLATVYGIVTQSGGQIVVASEPGVGTRFEIYFPQVEAAPTASDARSAPLRLTAPTGSETILLVEDDQRLRDLAHEVLAMQGYDVLVAPDPEEALRTCAAHAGPIHLLLTDVVMPHMSGRELADRLMPLRPETRVLYMSGYTDDAILHHGVHQAEVDLLQKPFTPVGLAQRVREALDAAEASSTHRRQAHGTDRGTRPPTTP